MKTVLTRYLSTHFPRTVLNSRDWARTGVLLDACSCIIFGYILLANTLVPDYGNVLFILLLPLRILLYLLLSPGRLSRKRVAFEIACTALATLIPFYVSGWCEDISIATQFFAVLLVINGVLYLVANLIPGLIPKKGFFIICLSFISIGTVGLLAIILVKKIPWFLLSYGVFLAICYIFIMAICSILRFATVRWENR